MASHMWHPNIGIQWDTHIGASGTCISNFYRQCKVESRLPDFPLPLLTSTLYRLQVLTPKPVALRLALLRAHLTPLLGERHGILVYFHVFSFTNRCFTYIGSSWLESP